MTRNRYMVAIVFLTFFVMSLLTNILEPDRARHYHQLQRDPGGGPSVVPSPSLLLMACYRFRQVFWWNALARSR